MKQKLKFHTSENGIKNIQSAYEKIGDRLLQSVEDQGSIKYHVVCYRPYVLMGKRSEDKRENYEEISSTEDNDTSNQQLCQRSSTTCTLEHVYSVFVADIPCHKNCIRKYILNHERDIKTNVADENAESNDVKESSWVLLATVQYHTSLHNDPEECGIPTWSAFNSILSSVDIPQKKTALTPILQRPATEFSAIYTCMKNYQDCLAIVNQNTGSLWADVGVNRITKEIQLLRPEEISNLFLGLGGFHLAKEVMNCLGKYFAGSGVENIFIENETFGPNVMDSVLAVKHYSCAMREFSMLAEALEHLSLKVFLENNTAPEHITKEFSELIVCTKAKKIEEIRTHAETLKSLMPGLMRKIETFCEGQCTENETFRCVAMDQVLKQNYNKPAKGHGGIIGVTRKKEPVVFHDLIKHEKVQIAQYLRDLCGLLYEDEYSLQYKSQLAHQLESTLQMPPVTEMPQTPGKANVTDFMAIDMKVAFRVGITLRYIPLHSLVTVNRVYHTGLISLPAINSLTGRDTTSKVSTKMAAMKTAESYAADLLFNFEKKPLNENMEKRAEEFLVHSLSPNLCTMDKLRFHQYHDKKICHFQDLAPTSRSIRQEDTSSAIN
ncbi:hypothetical protein PR048_004628 [Dryococelus australis]|uniref:Uncharacterized protein n=1 Tax=Dryococelus australis TaxID=614101 RepID=A0ABQ9I6C4_9NEOP|nr:hypothetical protein PR048_004628 [Dryococelus australis]